MRRFSFSFVVPFLLSIIVGACGGSNTPPCEGPDCGDSFQYPYPDQLSAGSFDPFQVTLEWSGVAEVDGYRVYYGTWDLNGTDATEGNSGEIVTNDTSITLTGLEGNTTYQLAVTAFGSRGFASEISPAVTVSVMGNDVTEKAQKPTVNPPSGTVVAPNDRIQMMSGPGAVIIKYTTGAQSAPERVTDGILYDDQNRPPVTEATTFKIRAFKNGLRPSDVTTASYTVDANVVAMPAIFPNGGTVPMGQEVTITGASDTTIRHAFNAEPPLCTQSGSPSNTVTVTINAAGVLKARACRGTVSSGIASATFQLSGGSAPATPALAVTVTVKQLNFSWNAIPTATMYRLSEDANGNDQWIVIAPSISGTTSYLHGIAVHRTNWGLARYRIEACNAYGCSAPSASVSLTLTDMIQAIGKFQGSNVSDQFATSMALSSDGQTLAVGVPYYDLTGQSDAGVVLVYKRTTSGWGSPVVVQADSPQYGNHFGWSVSLSADGTILAVGAPDGSQPYGGSNCTINGEGTVYVFRLVSGAWDQEKILRAPNCDYGDHFGYSVALSGNGYWLAAGAIGEDSPATTISPAMPINGNMGNNGYGYDAGAVYVFDYKTQYSTWYPHTYVKALPSQAQKWFGYSVALSNYGSALVVGAPGENHVGSPPYTEQVGGAHLFTRSNDNWSFIKRWEAPNAGFATLFGFSVSISDAATTVAVGAPGQGTDNGSDDASGAVYIFTPTGTWSLKKTIKASNPGYMDEFGYSIALSRDGSTLAVGAPFEDGNGIGINPAKNEAYTDAGAVYLFQSSDDWTAETYVKAKDTALHGQFGICVAASVNGSTIGVGAMNTNSGKPDAAYLY